jgi:fatty acid synthase subunit alpha, fungi type
LHPRYLFGALEPSVYESYKVRNRERAYHSYKAMSEMMISNSLVKVKDAPPYSSELEDRVLLDSMSRATLDTKTGSYIFKEWQVEPKVDVGNVDAVKDVLSLTGVSGVGVDQGSFYSYHSTFHILDIAS